MSAIVASNKAGQWSMSLLHLQWWTTDEHPRSPAYLNACIIEMRVRAFEPPLASLNTWSSSVEGQLSPKDGEIAAAVENSF